MISADLSGKTALVTGAASGIGLACVEALAGAGATVAMNDLPSNPALEREVQRLQSQGANIVAAPGAVGDADTTHSMVAEAITALGRLDFLVNNAGTPGTPAPIPPSDFKSQSDEFWQRLLQINLLGPFHCTVAAAAALRESSGAVVNIASIAGLFGNGSSSVYAATKAALINQTREHARAFAPNVRVNAIAPGVVVSNWECRFDRSEESIREIPLGRAGEPSDYAEVVLFLCAGGSYINGETIVVDGGRTAGPADHNDLKLP